MTVDKTPSQKLGYKLDDVFEIVGGDQFPVGTSVSLIRDDGTEMSMFRCELGERRYVSLVDVEKVAPGAVKFDAGKPMMNLVDPEWELGVAEVLTFGAKKYSPNNWQGLDVNRIEDALLRHINAHRRGEKLDGESGKSHLLHASCCLMMLHWKETNQEVTD